MVANDDYPFHTGDVVELISGGLPMTVVGESKETPGVWGCAWHDKNGVYQCASFHPACLRKVEPSSEQRGGKRRRRS